MPGGGWVRIITQLSHQCGPLHLHLGLSPLASISLGILFIPLGYLDGVPGFLFPVDFWFWSHSSVHKQVGVGVYCDNDLKYDILLHSFGYLMKSDTTCHPSPRAGSDENDSIGRPGIHAYSKIR